MNRAINERQLAIAKIKLAAALVVLVILVAGCKRAEGSAPVDLNTHTDIYTGCQYVTHAAGTAISPRIAADGKTHMGCKGVAP